MKSNKNKKGDTFNKRKMKQAARLLFIMSCIIPASTASADDLKTYGVKAGATAVVKDRSGKERVVALDADQQQQMYARAVVAKNKRSVNKWITALFTTTNGATPTALLGDAFAATGLADASGAWTFQNGAQGATSTSGKTAFNNMVIGQPFKYIGIQIDVSANALWNQLSWREYITDYDSTNNYDWKTKVNTGLNTYSQTTTTRFLRVGGEFNGNWAVYMTGFTTTTANQTVQFTFNCVDIQRSW